MKIIKKILIILGIKIIIIAIVISIVVVSHPDISDKELGPSPFLVDNDFTSEDNPEFKKIIELGKAIKGNKEFEEKFELDLKNPEPSILVLQNYIQANQEILDKVDTELFKACKLPKPKYEVGIEEDIPPKFEKYLRYLLVIMQRKITLSILTQDYEKAKNDLFKTNFIHTELTKKTTNPVVGMNVVVNKLNALDNIKLLINDERYPFEQKLEILNIKQEQISGNLLRTIAHFESGFLSFHIHRLINPPIKKGESLIKISNIPFLMKFWCQENKSEKLFREITSETISQFEEQSCLSFKEDEEVKPINPKFKDLIHVNFAGEKMAEMNPCIKLCAAEFLKHNNICNQLTVAKHILEFKLKTGNLPNNLQELGLDRKTTTDILTGEPFLYSAHNGILQSMGSKGKNGNPDLTSKELTPEEITVILKANEYGKDYILYLK